MVDCPNDKSSFPQIFSNYFSSFISIKFQKFKIIISVIAIKLIKLFRFRKITAKIASALMRVAIRFVLSFSNLLILLTQVHQADRTIK